jgi:AcrR family transcriptional regulator/DNA-binding MarR family transcriptional regulator
MAGHADCARVRLGAGGPVTATDEALAKSSRRRENRAPRAAIRELQRNRMITAAIDLIARSGYPAVTVATIIGRARVSRATFYSCFANRDDCFLAAFDETLSEVMALASRAYADALCWRSGVRASLACLLGAMDRQPTLARLWVVESLRGEDRIIEHRFRALDALARVVDEGRQAGNGRVQPPQGTADAIVDASVAMLHRRLRKADEAPLSELLGPMMYLIVLPYFGARDAHAELRRSMPAPAQPPAERVSHDDPFRGLRMRLTYRTVRVLDVIATCPGSSNREIAHRAAIADQGQISKLLSRLERLELVENDGPGQEKGGANAWRLTELGSKIANLMRPRTQASS